MPNNKLYKTIIADPPWDIEQSGNKGANIHYRLQTLDWIKSFPVADLVEENAHCWLWITGNTIEAGYDVMRAWGFVPRNLLTWVKPRMGLGRYLRSASEHLLFGTKGRAPILFRSQPNWIFAPVSEHSHKPEEVHAIVRRCSPGPYLELFARREQPGFDVWGDEVESDIVIPGYPVPRYKMGVKEDGRTPVSAARRLKISRPVLSLKTDITLSVVRAGLAAMAHVPKKAEITLQIILASSFAPKPAPRDIPDPHAGWYQIISGNVRPASNESIKVMRDKAAQNGFCACVRLGISKETAPMHFFHLLSALRTLESAGVHIAMCAEKAEALGSAYAPWHFPLRLSVKELANFLLLPIGETELAGATGLHPKQTLPPSWYKNPTSITDRSFATSVGALRQTRLSISAPDALEHAHLLGPTGSGKSTVMLNLIVRDITAGRSVLVIDPKSDLVNDVLARIPEGRDEDVVVIDPSDPCPVGFNPLAFKEYGDQTLIADAVLAVFKDVFTENWGIRSQDVLSAALLTLAQTDGASLLWLPALLTNENFRRKITSELKDKIGLEPYWAAFENMRDGRQQTEIAPVLNKIRQFLLRPGLRNVLGQPHPKFSLTDLFNQRKIVLVPLNKGSIGPESARLLGSLIVGLTWTLALSRARLPQSRRHMVCVYIDELQDYIRSFPTDLSDALAQARGLGVALTLAHQFRAQLPPNIRSAIDANTRNKIVFGLNSEDAKAMAAMTPTLDALDFMSLPRYQIYTEFQSGGRKSGWILGQTLPPPPATRDVVDLRAKSMARYGQPAEVVETEYLNIIAAADSDPPDDAKYDAKNLGRRKIQ
jgi:N6-adenosine-specific RNA methylase IME4